MMRTIIYQLFVRHFSNDCMNGVSWGTKEQNGCGTFNGVTAKALGEIKALGTTHVWLTGVLRHATQTGYDHLPADPVTIVKGIAGSPYAVSDYADVDPDLAFCVEKRDAEFAALIQRVKDVGMVPMIDFIPNHVSRNYGVHRDETREYVAKKHGHGWVEYFGDGDDASKFFSWNNSFFYLNPEDEGGGPPLKLPSGLYAPEEVYGKVTGNNAITWSPTDYDWYETVKLNYGFDFRYGWQAASYLPGEEADVTEVPRTWEIMDAILAFWQGKGIGGFRCDMAHLVPMAFWRWAIRRARLRNAQVYFVAEAYDDGMKTTEGDPTDPLLDAGFNHVYNAPTYHLSRHIYENGAWANDFDALCNNDDRRFSHAVRYLENHDEVRMGAEGHWGDVGLKVAPAISTLLYSLSPGAILFYNGQEVGECALGPGGYGGNNGRTSIFDYTCLPSMIRWRNRETYNGEFLDDTEKNLLKHYRHLMPLLHEPALSHGAYHGLNWFNRYNPAFGRLEGEPCSGHWVYAFLRYDSGSGQAVLVVCNLNPEWEFPHLRVIIPWEALSWMHWEGEHVSLRPLGSKSPLTDTYTLHEVVEEGVLVPLNVGEGIILEFIR